MMMIFLIFFYNFYVFNLQSKQKWNIEHLITKQNICTISSCSLEVEFSFVEWKWGWKWGVLFLTNNKNENENGKFKIKRGDNIG